MKCRNIAILLIVFLLIPGIPYAQQGSIMAGIEGGPGISFIRGSGSAYEPSSVSFAGAAGIFGEYGLWRDLSVRAALHYERKGSRIDNHAATLPAGGVLQYNLDYLSLPVLLKWNFGQHIRFFANAGPCISMLLGESLWHIPETGSKVEVADENGAYHTFEFSVAAGAGVAIPIGRNLLVSVELRDNLGVTNIRSQASAFESDNYIQGVAIKGFTNSTLLLAGVAWRFGGKKGMPCTPNDPDFQYIRK